MRGCRQGAWSRRAVAVLAAAVAGGGAVPLCAGVTHADESHAGSHNAPRVSLVSTGQIDDPLEDVLEHAAVLR